MNYESSKPLTDVRFKRLVGVQRTTFEEMLAVLKTAYQHKHAKGGRTPKLSLEDFLIATLQYMREYRTYEQIAADFGIHESNLIRRSQWVESTLIQSGFTISKTHLNAEDTVIVDAIQAAGVKRLTDIKLFDVFSGEKLGLGMKSMAYSLTFQNPEDSLTDEEVARYMEKIQASLEEKVNAEVR
ncbi:transposase family protein [Streptococcus sp. 1001175B_160314_H6]|uniref:helix-turn-helix domain-containing protein n=1 Tax=Streptococcus TaxID=1301 RepID=UPI001106D6B3